MSNISEKLRVQQIWEIAFHTESRARNAVNHVAEILTHHEEFKKHLSCFVIDKKERSEYREMRKPRPEHASLYYYKSYDEGYIVKLYTTSMDGVQSLVDLVEKHGRDLLNIHRSTHTDLPMEISKKDLYFGVLK